MFVQFENDSNVFVQPHGRCRRRFACPTGCPLWYSYAPARPACSLSYAAPPTLPPSTTAQGAVMLDIVFLTAGLAFLGLCLAYATLCEQL